MLRQLFGATHQPAGNILVIIASVTTTFLCDLEPAGNILVIIENVTTTFLCDLEPAGNILVIMACATVASMCQLEPADKAAANVPMCIDMCTDVAAQRPVGR